MKETELVKMLTFLGSSYPGKLKYPTNDDTKDTAFEEAWMLFLKDYKYETIMMVLKDFIPKNPVWPPTVGQIVSRLAEISNGSLAAEEAWEEAVRIGRKSYYQDSDEKIFHEKNVPENLRRAIRAVNGLEKIRLVKTEDPFLRRNFMAAYDSISALEENQVDPQLRDNIRDEIKKISGEKTLKLKGK